jgi:hypothetical protein
MDPPVAAVREVYFSTFLDVRLFDRAQDRACI